MKGPWLKLAAKGVKYKKDGTWHRMDDMDTWHILTALRGPDNRNDGLKHKYTAKIRGLFCSWTDDGNAMISRRPRWIYVVIIEKPEYVYKTNSGPTHWRRHINNALETVDATCGWPKWESTKS